MSEREDGAGPAGRPVLVTGAAGFIGFHVCRSLLAEGRRVVGIDNLDPYYSVALKEARLAAIGPDPAFTFERADLADEAGTRELFARHDPETVVHLAAQTGVRHSLVDPGAYGRANLVAFVNVLEGCRRGSVRHLVFASSSSVYGANESLPFRTGDPVDHPLNLYGATKRANELMAHSYASLFGLPVTGLRFFTVYGPWGRPDMAVFAFAEAIAAGRPIRLFNDGAMSRDFTYVDDAVAAVIALLGRPPAPEGSAGSQRPDAAAAAPFRILNVGSDAPVDLGTLVGLLEGALGRAAIVERAPMQPGDARATWADVTGLVALIGARPRVAIEDGIGRFVAWFKEYRGMPEGDRRAAHE